MRRGESVSPDKGLWRQSAHARSGMVVESEATCSLEEALYVRSTIVFINDASRGRNANNRPGLPLPARHPSNFASHPLELKFDASALRISTMQEQGKIQIPAREMARDVSSKAKVSEGSDDEV